MRKVFVGLVIAVIAGIGGYFGVTYWTQAAVAREVDAMLDGWRASVGSATRGRIEVDLWTRTIKITDVVVQARAAPYPKIAVAQVVASGVQLSGHAARVDIADLEMTDAVLGRPGFIMQQKVPTATLTGFSARPFVPRKAASLLDQMRLRLEQLSMITAASIEAPSLIVTVAPAAAAGSGARLLAPGSAEYTYTNIHLQDVRDGGVAQASVDGVALRAGMLGRLGEMKGEIGRSSIIDADLSPVLAFLDPTRPKGQGYQRIYRQVSVGPYAMRFPDGTGMHVDGIVADEVGLYPDKLSLDDLQFLTEIAAAPGGAGPPGQMAGQMPGQMTMVLDKVADLYQGVHLGKLEMQGFSLDGKGETAKLARLRLNGIENGRIGGISVEGLEGKPMRGTPFRFGRVAVKSFDIANFLRLIGDEIAAPASRGQPPSPERLARVLALAEGIELKDIALPDPKTQRTMQLQTFNADWGQLINKVPSEARLSLKLAMPISAPDPKPAINMLVEAGIRDLVLGADLAARWNEAARTVVAEPATLEIGGLMALSVKASAVKVQREAFTVDALKAMGAAAQAEIGPLEVTLRDLGLVDLVAADVARKAGRAPEEGRALLLEGWARKAQAEAEAHPGSRSFFEAMPKFLEGKGETLTVRLSPKGSVRILELIEAVRRDPPGALLGSFDIEARTGG